MTKRLGVSARISPVRTIRRPIGATKCVTLSLLGKPTCNTFCTVCARVPVHAHVWACVSYVLHVLYVTHTGCTVCYAHSLYYMLCVYAYCILHVCVLCVMYVICIVLYSLIDITLNYLSTHCVTAGCWTFSSGILSDCHLIEGN